MEFTWTDSDQTTYAERSIWNALKSTFITDEGLCYYRYPTFSADRSQREPDFLILHREWGLYVIDCKPFNIDNIERIDGPLWLMRNWHTHLESPYVQAEDQIVTVLNKFTSVSELRKGRKNSAIEGHVFIALPYITRGEWRERHFDESLDSLTTIIFADDLESDALRACLQQVLAEEKQAPITDKQWTLAISILRGSPVLRREPRPEARPQTKAALLRQVEEQMQVIDREQHKVAVQIPDGPQRIRGLAGSGKTVVMCMKVAEMHLRHPNWDIAYTFYTRTLYAQIKNLITRFFRFWNTDHEKPEPNWTKLRILHGWGGRDGQGLYSMVSLRMQHDPRTYSEARNVFSHNEQSELLGQCCQELLDNSESIPTLFDAIVIDEAQDFHFNFYRLCHSVLREPKRLIWAYDEVQSLESLSIPTTIDIFGTLADGSPVVNLYCFRKGVIC